MMRFWEETEGLCFNISTPNIHTKKSSGREKGQPSVLYAFHSFALVLGWHFVVALRVAISLALEILVFFALFLFLSIIFSYNNLNENKQMKGNVNI